MRCELWVPDVDLSSNGHGNAITRMPPVVKSPKKKGGCDNVRVSIKNLGLGERKSQKHVFVREVRLSYIP